MSEPLLQAEHLVVHRGEVPLINDVSFVIYAGELLQVHGDNGVGKSTLLRALCTLLPIESGELRWAGNSVLDVRDQYLSSLCFYGHTEGLKTDLTAMENLFYCPSISNVTQDSAMQALNKVGMAGREELLCRVLSAGQRRRVALARFLLSDAKLWIMDEPLTALDAQGRELVVSLIDEQVTGGGGVIFSTHQPISFADRSVKNLVLDVDHV